MLLSTTPRTPCPHELPAVTASPRQRQRCSLLHPRHELARDAPAPVQGPAGTRAHLVNPVHQRRHEPAWPALRTHAHATHAAMDDRSGTLPHTCGLVRRGAAAAVSGTSSAAHAPSWPRSPPALAGQPAGEGEGGRVRHGQGGVRGERSSGLRADAVMRGTSRDECSAVCRGACALASAGPASRLRLPVRARVAGGRGTATPRERPARTSRPPTPSSPP